MRRILFLLLFITTSSYCQLKKEALINRAIEQLQILQSDVHERLVKIQDFDSESLIVIPVVSEEGDGYILLDAYLVLVENRTGNIISRYSNEKEWSSDAMFLSEINIDPKIFKLGFKKEAFGIRINYLGSSNANSYESTQLSLFLKDGRRLKKILEDYSTFLYTGATDAHCIGEFETHTKTFKVEEAGSEGYADLVFIDIIEKTATDEDCEPTVIENREEKEILQFRNGRYAPRD